ncbi:hypothetical protein RHMOL_Rhmol10G0140600 [Rhododendron molle]|uniref:Uncharacterized protein n=1 Tax=Rhododendron molle TaxID=49168 RepID=A0ACC0M242_RHOML|nr:hypothetical protein RHMOL_Rhmol10G0140600 [Rhododendron molle]
MLPPDVCSRAGRPKKATRRELEEQATENPDPTRLGRKGTKMTCSICGVEGHNKRSCKKGPVVDTNADGTTPEQGPVEGSNGPLGTTPIQGPLGATNGLQTSIVVGNNYGGPSGMTVDGGQPHSGTKLPVRRKMKVVEKRSAQVVEIGSSEVLEAGLTQSSITTQLLLKNTSLINPFEKKRQSNVEVSSDLPPKPIPSPAQQQSEEESTQKLPPNKLVENIMKCLIFIFVRLLRT